MSKGGKIAALAIGASRGLTAMPAGRLGATLADRENPMCYLIYGALLLTLAVYSDALIGEYALSVDAGGGQWTQVAQGWELAAELWPLFALAAVGASALTWLVAHRR
jgi:hypothetical protein